MKEAHGENTRNSASCKAAELHCVFSTCYYVFEALCRVQRLLCLSLLNMTDSAMEVSYLMHPLAVYCSRIFTTSIYPHPRPLRPCAEPQAGVSPPRRSPLIYTWYYICIYVYAWYENRPEYTSTHRPYRHTVASGVGDRGRNQCKTIFVWYTCVALPTKQKMWYGL